jgi:hypothetical protein
MNVGCAFTIDIWMSKLHYVRVKSKRHEYRKPDLLRIKQHPRAKVQLKRSTDNQTSYETTAIPLRRGGGNGWCVNGP